MHLSEDDLTRLLEATRAVASTLQLSELLQTVMRLATDVVKAEASALLLMDQATGELYFDVALGEKGSALQQIRLKKGEGIAGWVAQHREPTVVNDVSKDPRWTNRADRKTQFQTRAILAVPMMVRDKLVGVMEVINRSDGQPFNESDMELLKVFAAQAAIAIENARLFESIRQEKEKMSTVFGEMKEGALLLDAQGHILLANPAAQELLDKPDAEGTQWESLESLFEIHPSWSEFQRTLGGAGGIELKRIAPPLLQLAGIMTQVCDDKGKITGYLAMFRDVTEERREAQLKRNFLSLVSHKLKTPLVVLRGYVPLLLSEPETLQPFQKQALEAIDRSSQQLATLVDKIIRFSTIEADTVELTRQTTTVSELIDGALLDLKTFLSAYKVLLTKDDKLTSIPPVLVDKIWLQEVFRNVIENAVKFNPKPDKEIHCTAVVTPYQTVEVSIRDNGPGIPPEEQDKVFQKFYQIEANFTGQVQGMGLGLALVKKIVEEHGGSIALSSMLGQGSTFSLTLPLAH